MVEHKACWKDLVKPVLEGVLTLSDTVFIEVAACLMAEMRSNTADSPSSKMSLLNNMYGKMYMNPTARQKMAIPKKATVNEFDEF
jgi:hypothetical protein